MTAVHSDFLKLVRLGIGHRAEALSANPDWDAIYAHALKHGLPAVLEATPRIRRQPLRELLDRTGRTRVWTREIVY